MKRHVILCCIIFSCLCAFALFCSACNNDNAKKPDNSGGSDAEQEEKYIPTEDKYFKFTYSYEKEGYIINMTDEFPLPEKTNIPAEHEGHPVVCIKEAGFASCRTLKSVILPDNITEIGNDAFGGCTNLETITLPDGIKSIGSEAFRNCIKLTSVTIPNRVTIINDYTFYGCDELTNITIPNSVTSIGKCAFYSCKKLTELVIPNGVVTIKDHAFYDCIGITNVIFPLSITSIGDSAFKNCANITNIFISKNVITIGSSAFGKCINLNTVHWNAISSNTENSMYYDSPFESCSKLTTIIFGKDVTTIPYKAFEGSPITEITIPQGVTSIGANAFNNCKNLKSVNIPDSVISIGHRAFNNCSSLTKIIIPASVSIIGHMAFGFCNNLTIYCIHESKPGNWSDAWNSSGLQSTTTYWSDEWHYENGMPMLNS